MVYGGLVILERAGRHRHYRLANAEVALALEALGAIATPAPPARSLSPDARALRRARTCYDHLAGVLAVHLTDWWLEQELLVAQGPRDFVVTGPGAEWFRAHLQIDTARLAGSRRPLARQCLDWTERRPHVAGALGAMVLTQLLARRWVARTPDPRRLRVTTSGRSALSRFGLDGPELFS
jgi:hypothetical protein